MYWVFTLEAIPTKKTGTYNFVLVSESGPGRPNLANSPPHSSRLDTELGNQPVDCGDRVFPQKQRHLTHVYDDDFWFVAVL